MYGRQETDERYRWDKDERFPQDEIQRVVQQVYATNRAYHWNCSTVVVRTLLDGLRREW